MELERGIWEISPRQQKSDKKKIVAKGGGERFAGAVGPLLPEPHLTHAAVWLLLRSPNAAEAIPGRTAWLLLWELLQVFSQPANLLFKKQGRSTMWVPEQGMCLQPLRTTEHKKMFGFCHKNTRLRFICEEFFWT